MISNQPADSCNCCGNKLRVCPSSPTGLHCFCNVPSGPYWSIIPPTPICCWCGQPNMPHGPYRQQIEMPSVTVPYINTGVPRPTTGTITVSIGDTKLMYDLNGNAVAYASGSAASSCCVVNCPCRSAEGQ